MLPLFFPFSAADNCWPDLHRVTREPNNAVPSTLCFTVKWILYSLARPWNGCRMELASLWVASTWQYSCAWVFKLSNKPGLCNLVKTVAQGWKLEQIWRLHEQYPSFHQMANDVQLQIRAEQEAQAAVIAYADWLVTTMNDALPQNNWTVPSRHQQYQLKM